MNTLSITHIVFQFQLIPLSEAVTSNTQLNPTELTVITSTLEQTVNQTATNETVSTTILITCLNILSMFPYAAENSFS